MRFRWKAEFDANMKRREKKRGRKKGTEGEKERNNQKPRVAHARKVFLLNDLKSIKLSIISKPQKWMLDMHFIGHIRVLHDTGFENKALKELISQNTQTLKFFFQYSEIALSALLYLHCFHALI